VTWWCQLMGDTAPRGSCWIYRAQSAASRDILAAGDLDARCARSDLVDENLRWVAMHMIQETARHAGHADIIREAIDGSRGHRP